MIDRFSAEASVGKISSAAAAFSLTDSRLQLGSPSCLIFKPLCVVVLLLPAPFGSVSRGGGGGGGGDGDLRGQAAAARQSSDFQTTGLQNCRTKKGKATSAAAAAESHVFLPPIFLIGRVVCLVAAAASAAAARKSYKLHSSSSSRISFLFRCRRRRHHRHHSLWNVSPSTLLVVPEQSSSLARAFPTEPKHVYKTRTRLLITSVYCWHRCCSAPKEG